MDGQSKRSYFHFKLAVVAFGLAVGAAGLWGGSIALGGAMEAASVEQSELQVAPPNSSALGSGPVASVSVPVTTAVSTPVPVAATTIPAPTRQEETEPAAAVKEDEEWAAKPAVEAFKPAIPADAFKNPIEEKLIGGDKTAAAASADNTTTTATTSGSGGILSGLQDMVKVGGALIAVLGLVFLLKGAARKFVPGAQTGGGKGVIEVLARHPLSKNQALVLVRIGSQIVAINQGKDQSQSMLVISEPTEVAKIMGQIEGTNPKSIQSGFTSLLANARMDLEKSNEDAFEPQAMQALGRRPLGSRSMEPPSIEPEDLDSQLDEMAAAKRQLMQLRQQVRSVRDSIPR